MQRCGSDTSQSRDEISSRLHARPSRTSSCRMSGATVALPAGDVCAIADTLLRHHLIRDLQYGPVAAADTFLRDIPVSAARLPPASSSDLPHFRPVQLRVLAFGSAWKSHAL